MNSTTQLYLGLPLEHANPTKLVASNTLTTTNMAQHRVGIDGTPTIINDGPDFTKEQTLNSETSSNTKAETAPPLENVANGTDRPWNEHALEKPGTYDKVEITEDDCYDELGYSFPSWEKWMIFTVSSSSRYP